MELFVNSLLQKILGNSGRNGKGTQINQFLLNSASKSMDEIFLQAESSSAGLSQSEAEERLENFGANTVAEESHHTKLKIFAGALINPLVILLSILAVVSFLTGDTRAAIVVILMVVLGVALRFAQEARADTAAAKLNEMIDITATVLRDGELQEIPIKEIVPGDIVKLSAGDMIPADVYLISAKDLFVIQSSFSGESLPVEKMEARGEQKVSNIFELKNICFLGTSVESGTALAIVLSTGAKTYLGSMANAMVRQETDTEFDKGVSRFTWLMIRFMLVMVPMVFLINGLTKHNWREAFFFALAVAVGMTPEMLPMIVTVCLSKGAIAMSRKKVIVKRLNSIQNFGAMDVLCTDKTGTLTMDRVILEKHCDVMLDDDDNVLHMAFLNSHFQTGSKNVLDRAILAHTEVHEKFKIIDYHKIDEIPFDFVRRLMSVVVKKPEGGYRLICKGAPEEIFKRCPQFEYKEELHPMEQILIHDLRLEYENLSADGFRMLAVAYRDFDDPEKIVYSKDDENDLTLIGYVAFLDPPKDSALPAIKVLQDHGVTVKILTGDNKAVSKKICHEVGLSTENIIMGAQIEDMNDDQLYEVVEKTSLFVRLAPNHKQRIIKALQKKGHVVGFLGDGINDALALRAADVGISVDSAADIAKESADLILLEKSLMVLEEGVLEGRKVFANILKYIRMGASSSFGNMFSVVGASAFLPFLPMTPIQILTNNLLYDFSQVPIPVDDVDPEQIARPRPWSMKEISRFIIFIGPCSSIFDYTTYFIMLYVFKAWNNAPLFQTGWFIESILTQTLIIHIIRTNKIPFIQSRASWPLTATTILIMLIGLTLPYTPFADALGFTHLPPLYWPLLLLTLLGYILLTQRVKVWMIKKAWV